MALRRLLTPFGRGSGRWLAAISLCAWLGLLATEVLTAGDLHRHHPAMHGNAGASGFGFLTGWSIMLFGMAPLLLRGELGLLAQKSLRRNRAAAIAAFVGGYGFVWGTLGAFAAGLAARTWTVGALLAALLAVLVWHAAPLRQACLNACHRLPALRTFGPAAIADAGRFGLRTGLLCCAICGPAMVLCMLLPAGHVAAMAAVTMLAFLERQMPPKRRTWRVPLPSFAAEPGWRWLTLPDRTA